MTIVSRLVPIVLSAAMLLAQIPAPAPQSGSASPVGVTPCAQLGLQYFQTTGNVTWICIATGTPGTWAQLPNPFTTGSFTQTLGGNLLTTQAITTSGTAAVTFALPSSGAPTYTFPTGSSTLATLGANTFTGSQNFHTWIDGMGDTLNFNTTGFYPTLPIPLGLSSNPWSTVAANTSVTSPLVIGGINTNSPLTLQTTSNASPIAGSDLIIKSGPAELVRVLGGGTGAGNVGIGTATPGAMLEVNGNIKASGLQIGSSLPGLGTQTTPGTGVTGPLDLPSNRLLSQSTSDLISGAIDNSKYDAFGVLVQARSGKITYYFREGASDVGAGDFGTINYMSSLDGGKTFGADTVLFSESSVDLRNVAGGITSTGRIVIWYARTNPAAGTLYSMVAKYSDDEGASWSSAFTVPLGPQASSFASPLGRVVSLPNGNLLQTWYGNNGTHYNSNIALSTDNGATWGPPTIVVTSNSSVQTSETSCVYVSGSFIVCLAREDSVSSKFRQAHSTDSGATWTDDGDTSFGSSPPAPPELGTYIDESGARVVSLFYVSKSTAQINIHFGMAADLINSGTSGWNSVIAATSVLPSGAPGYISAILTNAGAKYYLVVPSELSTSDAESIFQTGTMPLLAVTTGTQQIAPSIFNVSGWTWIGSTQARALGSGITAAFFNLAGGSSYFCFGCDQKTGNNPHASTGNIQIEFQSLQSSQGATPITIWTNGNTTVGAIAPRNPQTDNTFVMGGKSNNKTVLQAHGIDVISLDGSGGETTLVGNQTLGTSGMHRNANAANKDAAGVCTFVSSVCTVTFTTAYTSAPACVASDQTTALATFSVLPSTTQLVITGGASAGATDVMSYACFGNPN